MRFCRSHIWSVIMFHVAKHSSIRSIFCDFRHATTSSLNIQSCFSPSCKDWFHACPIALKILLSSQITKICYQTMNLNSLEIYHDHIFRVCHHQDFDCPGGYWTACNNCKRYYTLPYCVLSAAILSPTVLDKLPTILQMTFSVQTIAWCRIKNKSNYLDQ